VCATQRVSGFKKIQIFVPTSYFLAGSYPPRATLGVAGIDDLSNIIYISIQTDGNMTKHVQSW
jgi:hypothetical protein